MDSDKNEKYILPVFGLIWLVLITIMLYLIFDLSLLLSIILACVIVSIVPIWVNIYSIMVKNKKESFRKKIESEDKYVTDRLVQQKLQLATPDNASDIISDLISAGAWLLCCDANSVPELALTEHCGVTKCDFLQKDAVKPRLSKRSENAESYTYTTTAPKASATKRAVVGGLIGGPVGAVVGAVSANEANAKGTTEETHTGYFHKYYYSLEINGKQFEEFCVSKEIYDKYFKQKPLLVLFYSCKKKDDYYLITGRFIDTAGEELEQIYEKFENIWAAMNS